MTEKPTVPEQESEILSFEKFSEISGSFSRPAYGNFFVYFSGPTGINSAYLKQSYYIKFKKENPLMNEELIKLIKETEENKGLNLLYDDLDNLEDRDNQKLVDEIKKKIENIELNLYEAYKIMRTYKGVSDTVLFR